MKRLILRLLYSNEERGIIKAALYAYGDNLSNIRSETCKDISAQCSNIVHDFKYSQEDGLHPINCLSYFSNILKHQAVKDFESRVSKLEELNSKNNIFIKDLIAELKWKDYCGE